MRPKSKNILYRRQLKYCFVTRAMLATKRRKVARSDKFYHIPLPQTLKKLLSLEEFQSEIHIMADSNILGDFCDGSLFKAHPLFSSDVHALQIIAYYDELEIVNPIVSYVKKHKLGCLFFFLANVRPQLLKLFIWYRSQDIDYYGIDKFLTPFVEDLKEIYCDGIAGFLNGEPHTYYGALLAFVADTLAAHALGGFKGSMSFALRICRTCMISPPEISGCVSEIDCQLRNPDTHFEQCAHFIWSSRSLFHIFWYQSTFNTRRSSRIFSCNRSSP